jgi:hypothetical protein
VGITRLLDLYRHMEWADALAWSAVSAWEPAVADTRIRHGQVSEKGG